MAGGTLSAPGAVIVPFPSLAPGASMEIDLSGYREGAYAVQIRWPDGSVRTDTLGFLHPDLAFTDTPELVRAGKELQWRAKQHPRLPGRVSVALVFPATPEIALLNHRPPAARPLKSGDGERRHIPLRGN